MYSLSNPRGGPMGLALEMITLTLVINVSGQEQCEKGTWFEAQNCCKAIAGYLPKLKKYRNGMDLIDPMNENNYTSVWLSYRRIIQSQWTWVDGSLPKHPPRDVQQRHCGFMNLTTNTIQASICGTVRGFICEKRGCTSCNSLQWGAHLCVHREGSCFVPVCDWNSWYNARAACVDSDMDLAVVTSNDVIKLLPSCDSYWIGIRKEIWTDEEKREIMLGLWGKSQPKWTGNCSVFSRRRGEFQLETYACIQQASIICLHMEATTTKIWFQPTTYLSSANKTTDTPIMMNMIKWIATGIGIAVSVLLAVMVLCLLHRRKICSRYIEVPVRDNNTIAMPKENVSMKEDENRLRLLLAETQKRLFNITELWSWHGDLDQVKLDDLYVDLVLVKTENTPQMPKMKKLSSYTEMFTEVQSYQKGNIFYLQGDAGMGKSTLTQKIALDWSDICLTERKLINAHSLKKIRYVVHIVLRNIKSGQNLNTIIKEQLTIKEDDAADLVKEFESNQQSTLLILDGYDEYNETLSSEITEILHRKHYQYINILISSRHPFKVHIANVNTRPDVSLMLRGFTKEGVNEYINKFFKNQEFAESLLEKIEDQNDYREFSRCPALLLLMTVLYRDNHKLPASITGFFEEFLKYLLGRHERKRLSLKECTAPENILMKYHDKLMRVAEVARFGLTEGSTLVLNFTYNSVVSKIDDAWGYGIFRRVVCHNGCEGKVYFLHKTFQEFFIAYFIVHVSPSQETELWLQLCRSYQALRDANMILKFVAGLGKESFLQKLEMLSSGSSEEVAAFQTSIHMNYLSENQDMTLNLPSVVNLQVSNKHSINLYIKYLRMNGDHLQELILQVCKLEHARLTQHVQAKKLSTIRLFLNSDTTFMEEAYVPESLESTMNNIKLEELEIGGFDLTRNESCQRELSSLLNVIGGSSSLHTVMFTVVTLSDLQVKELSKAISESKIKRLVLRKCEQFKVSNLVDIISVLPKCPSLTHLDVSRNAFGNDIQSIVVHIDKMKNLEELDLSLNQCSPASRDLICTEMKKYIPKLSLVFDDDLITDFAV